MKTIRIFIAVQILASCLSYAQNNSFGDFARRYGASSRLLQRPLYFREYECAENCNKTCTKKICSKPCNTKACARMQ